MATPIDLPDLRSQIKVEMRRQDVNAVQQSFNLLGTALDKIVRSATEFGLKSSQALQQADAATRALRQAVDGLQQDYTKAASQAERVSADWTAATYKINNAQMEIGRTIAQQTLPAMRLQAALMADMANLAKNNPQIVGAGAGALGALHAANIVSQGVGGALGGGDTARAAGGIAGLGVLGIAGLGALASATKDQTGLLGSIHQVLEGGFNSLINQISHIAPEFANELRGAVGSTGGIGSRQSYQPGSQFNADSALAGSGGAQAIQQFAQAQLQAQRSVNQEEMQLGDQRVRLAIQQARAIMAEEISLARQREDLTRQQGRSFEDQAISQGRQYADAVLQNDRQNRDTAVNIARQQGIALRDLYRQQELERIDFERQRARQERDFNLGIAREDAAFQYSQTRELAAFNLQQANAQIAYDIQRRRDQEDHSLRLLEMADSRDALGVWKENRQFNLQQARAQEDFNLQRYQANQQRQIQLKDELYQFNLQRQYRLEDYKRQQADQLQDMAWRRERELSELRYRQRQEDEAFEFQKQQQQVHLRDLVDDQLRANQRLRDDMTLQNNRFTEDQKTHWSRFFEDQKTAATFAEQDMLIDWQHFQRNQKIQLGYITQDITNNLKDEQGLRQTYYAKMRDDLKIWMGDQQAILTGTQKQYEEALTDAQRAVLGLPPIHNRRERAEGGYMSNGLYRVGERGDEFAMSNSTTRAAEAALGGRLTQERLLAGLRSGASGGASMGSIILEQNFTFHGSFTEADKNWFRQTARDEASEAIIGAVENVIRKRVR